MQPEELTDRTLEEVLRRQPRWTPPAHFARAVVARIPPAPIGRRLAPSSPDFLVLRAAAVGGLAACLACAAGLVLSWALLRLAPDAQLAAAAYQMLLTVATATLVEHATAVAWITAAVMIWIAASITGRAQEWI